jgi:hypothetical protein
MPHFNSIFIHPFPLCKSLVSLLIFAVSGLLFINAEASEFKGVASIGWDLWGGDVVATGTGNVCGNLDVKANNGVVISAGGVVINGAFETQATVGYKHASPSGAAGSMVWDTIPLELLQFYRTGDLRMGLGVAYHVNSKLIVDVPGSAYSTYYNNALGGIVQLGWAPTTKAYSIDLRYTVIQYQQQNAVNIPDTNGNVLGIYVSYYF